MTEPLEEAERLVKAIATGVPCIPRAFGTSDASDWSKKGTTAQSSTPEC